MKTLTTKRERQVKRDQDRVAMLLSYDEMCRVFKTPKDKRVTAAEFAAMDNAQVMQVCRDLYNSAPIKKAKKLAKRLTDRRSLIDRALDLVRPQHAKTH